jgi:DNA polymerase III alpha subunit
MRTKNICGNDTIQSCLAVLRERPPGSSIQDLVDTGREAGVRFFPPSVNGSFDDTGVSDKSVVLGLKRVFRVPEETLRAVCDRSPCTGYTEILDVIRLVPLEPGTFFLLLKSCALDTLGPRVHQVRTYISRENAVLYPGGGLFSPEHNGVPDTRHRKTNAVPETEYEMRLIHQAWSFGAALHTGVIGAVESLLKKRMKTAEQRQYQNGQHHHNEQHEQPRIVTWTGEIQNRDDGSVVAGFYDGSCRFSLHAPARMKTRIHRTVLNSPVMRVRSLHDRSGRGEQLVGIEGVIDLGTRRCAATERVDNTAL